MRHRRSVSLAIDVTLGVTEEVRTSGIPKGVSKSNDKLRCEVAEEGFGVVEVEEDAFFFGGNFDEVV